MTKRVCLLVPLAAILAMATIGMMPLKASAATSLSANPHQQVTQSSTTKTSITPNVTNMTYHSGPVVTNTMNAYAIFWEPFGRVSANYNFLITRYFNDVGGHGLYNNNSQYTNSSGGHPTTAVLAGVWDDITSYPESPLQDIDIQHEVSAAQSANGWSSSLNNVFFVFLDKGQDVCRSSGVCASNSFCGYHGSFGSNTLYATLPYAASFSCNPGSSPNHDDADWTINITSHEQMEAATDPLGTGWFAGSQSGEIGDLCNFIFGTRDSQGGNVNWNGDEYIVQEEWDNRASGCVITGP